MPALLTNEEADALKRRMRENGVKNKRVAERMSLSRQRFSEIVNQWRVAPENFLSECEAAITAEKNA
jgi:predicted DNA-binding protein (UPF0251 family)